MNDISKSVRDAVKAKFGGRCAYCGIRTSNLTCDHIIPKSRFSPNADPDDKSNLFPACEDCNELKANMSVQEFRIKLLEKKIEIVKSRRYRMLERFGMFKDVSDDTVVFYFEKHRSIGEQK